jgi:hypothetical protein
MGNKEKSSKELLSYFQCNKTGHIKVDCPLLQYKMRNHHHNKAMTTTGSDNSDSSLHDQEKHVANMCFIAIENENELQSLDDESNPNYNELHDALESLYDEFKKLGLKYSLLKKNYACLFVEKETLENKTCIVIDENKKVNQLEKENKSLKEKVEKLNTTLAKFIQGSKILENMFSCQKKICFHVKGVFLKKKKKRFR